MYKKNFPNRNLNSNYFFSDGGLLEISKNVEKLTGHEKVFYFDQQTTRECQPSEEIDLEFGKQQQSIQENKLKEKQQQQSEHDFIMQDDEQEEQEETPFDNEATEFLNSSINTSNISTNRSGHAHIQYTGVDVAVQTEYVSD